MDPIDSELADVLNRRLEQLRDDEWIRGVLTRALAGLCDGPVELDSHEIDYCKIKPGRDINVALPLDRLRELVAQGVVGSMADTHYSTMGYQGSDTRVLENETAPAIAEAMRSEEVDLALLAPV